MLAMDQAVIKMIIILSKWSMGSDLVRSVGAGVVLVLGASILPAHAAQPVVVAVDGTLCDITKTLAAGAASLTSSPLGQERPLRDERTQV